MISVIVSSVSTTELLWTLWCLFGAYYAAKLFRRSIKSITSLRRQRINSIREYSAQLTVITYFLILFVQVMFVIAGILAMLVPPADPKVPVSALSVIITITFMTCSFIFATGSYIIENRRQRLVKMIESIESEF